jgi:LmbE family N-acetylglucosaminyl deacetylase
VLHYSEKISNKVKLFDPDPHLKWLFCLTHPDDEIAIAAWMRECVRNGCDVWAWWSHDVPVREAESRAAMASVGIPDERLHFFHGPDQGLVDRLDELLRAFASEAEALSPDRIVCGAYEQGHIDHDATNFLVTKTFPDVPILEFPLYHPYSRRIQTVNRFATPEDQEILTLDSEQQRFKRNIGKSYPSQNIWSILWWNEVLGYLSLRPKRLFATERLRLKTHFDFLTPNLPPGLAAEVRKTAIWRRWKQAIRRFE